jgi:hypothetical protein
MIERSDVYLSDGFHSNSFLALASNVLYISHMRVSNVGM